MGVIADLRTESILFHHSVDDRRTEEYALHCHHLYEVYYFVRGEVSYLVEGARYYPAPHSIILIPPNVFHGVKIENDSPYERYALHFVPGFLSLENRPLLLSPYHPAAKPSDFYFPNAVEFGLLAYFEQLMACGSMGAEMRDMAIRIRLEALLTQLLVMSGSTDEKRPEASASKTVARVIAYLNDRIAEPVSLDELAAAFFISKHHLNKVFRKATGTTVGNYVAYKKVVLAQQLMLQGRSAGDASSSAGFHDYSTFFRAYKKVFGHAPTDRRNSLLLG